MTVIVQVITTRWTKASRGAPRAALRAAVPEGALLPERFPHAPFVVHELEAAEMGDFELRCQGARALERLPAVVAGVRLADVGAAIEVVRLADARFGWPPRPHDRVVFRLEAGLTGRVVRNNRHAGRVAWSYSKTVVNVANVAEPTRAVFSAEPALLVDEQELLR